MAMAVGASAADNPMAGRSDYRAAAKKEALATGLPADIADAVMAVESSYNPSRIGGVGEIGLMQVRPATAAMLGFGGTAQELADPATNIHYGVAYLSTAWRLAGGDLCRALMKYRAGHREETMTQRSVDYCVRARAHLASINSPYAGALVPFAVSTGRPLPPIQRLAAIPKPNTHLRDKAFWAAHETRIRLINARIEKRWRQFASR